MTVTSKYQEVSPVLGSSEMLIFNPHSKLYFIPIDRGKK